MKKVESLTLNNTIQELDQAFEDYLNKVMTPKSIAVIKSDQQSFFFLYEAFKAGRNIGTHWIIKELDKYDVYEKE